MLRKLILLVNDALELNLEENATLHDDALRSLAEQVQVEQENVQGEFDSIQREIDKVFARLHNREVWEDGHKFGQAIRSLQDHFVAIVDYWRRQKKLETLEDRIQTEQFTRIATARGIGYAQAQVLEITHATVCSYSRNSAA